LFKTTIEYSPQNEGIYHSGGKKRKKKGEEKEGKSQQRAEGGERGRGAKPLNWKNRAVFWKPKRLGELGGTRN